MYDVFVTRAPLAVGRPTEAFTGIVARHRETQIAPTIEVNTTDVKAIVVGKAGHARHFVTLGHILRLAAYGNPALPGRILKLVNDPPPRAVAINPQPDFGRLAGNWNAGTVRQHGIHRHGGFA